MIYGVPEAALFFSALRKLKEQQRLKKRRACQIKLRIRELLRKLRDC